MKKSIAVDMKVVGNIKYFCGHFVLFKFKKKTTKKSVKSFLNVYLWLSFNL